MEYKKLYIKNGYSLLNIEYSLSHFKRIEYQNCNILHVI